MTGRTPASLFRIGALVIAAGALLGWGCHYVLQSIAFGEDLGRRPPAEVFRMVFGFAPSPGVTGLRAAGRHYFTKQWVWLSFDATDAAVRDIVARSGGEGPLTGAEAARALKENWSANSRYDALDKAAVGWGGWDAVTAAVSRSLPRPLPPEVYSTSSGEPIRSGGEGLIWRAVVIVDRSRHRVYVHAIGD
jgi:hypothetical protein